MNRTVLVTGATGIVGSNLVRALLDSAYNVRVLIRGGSDLRGLYGLPVDHYYGDVLEPATVASAAKGCSVVFHAAAVFSYWGHEAANQLDLAVRGTRNVVRAAQQSGATRVIVTSSSVVFGSRAGECVLDETAEFCEPNASAYTLSKVQQEQAAFASGSKFGVEVVAVCPTLVVGPFDYRLSPSNAYIVNYLNDPFRSTFGGGCNIVSARDVGVGHVLAAEKGRSGSRYILGSENLSWREVHELISDLTGTFGPSLRLNNMTSYLAALAAEVSARIMDTAPMVTRDEAKMSARFYWYAHKEIAKLGFAPMAARQALAEAIAWLIHRSYIAHSVMERLTLCPEVCDARDVYTQGTYT